MNPPAAVHPAKTGRAHLVGVSWETALFPNGCLSFIDGPAIGLKARVDHANPVPVFGIQLLARTRQLRRAGRFRQRTDERGTAWAAPRFV